MEERKKAWLTTSQPCLNLPRERNVVTSGNWLMGYIQHRKQHQHCGTVFPSIQGHLRCDHFFLPHSGDSKGCEDSQGQRGIWLVGKLAIKGQNWCVWGRLTTSWDVSKASAHVVEERTGTLWTALYISIPSYLCNCIKVVLLWTGGSMNSSIRKVFDSHWAAWWLE